jgi:hypothetical protein
LASFGAKNGKHANAPSLTRYDNMRPSTAAPTATSLYREVKNTHDADVALLEALGVDGDVPLAQARINAGLDLARTANDNHEIAAKAA